MKNLIPPLKRLVQSFVLAACVTAATAADTNVTHVSALQAQKLIAKKNIVVLDVRTPKELAAGHIAGATNINFRSPDFAKAIAGLNTNQNYLVHCASGGRSTQALPVFQKLQFHSVYHLDGGIQSWEKAGLHVTQ
jgi:rhodanese-related sulfurtransferase